MKKTLLFLLFLIAANAHSQLSITVCDYDDDGVEMVDLTSFNAGLIAYSGLPGMPAVAHYTTQADAVNQSNPIANPSVYITGSAIIFSTVVGSTTIFASEILVSPVPATPDVADVTACNFYDLPALPNGQNYYTEPNGGGTTIPAGIVITATQTLYIWATNGNCSSDSSFTVTIVATPIISPIEDALVCDAYTLPLLAVGNYYSQPGGVGPISYGTLITSTQTIYVYAQNAAMCAAEESFIVTVDETPDPYLEGGTICKDFTTGIILQPFILSPGLLNPNIYTYVWSLNGTLIAGATSANFSATEPGFYSVNIAAIAAPFCTYTLNCNVSLSSPPVINSVSVDNQTITVSVSGYSNDFDYLMDGTISNDTDGGIFTNVSLGTHSIQVFDGSGCGTTMVSNIEVTTPSEPFGAPIQVFSSGQTLADVVAVGQNIQWYANDSTSGKLAVDTPLPLTTVLVNNTTYYASQTINGIESPDRFGVLVTVGLGLQDNAFAALNYYPNPVKNSLKMTNAEMIDSINITSILGQTIFSNAVNSLETEIDLSGFSHGLYFVRVNAGNQYKTIRIIKE